MDIFARFATDPQKEQDGISMPLDETTKLVIRRFGNEDYQALNRKLRERHKVVLEGTDIKLAEKTSMDILIEAMANHILVGWEGVTYNGTTELPYSVSNAEMLLKLKDFRDTVFVISNNAENYRFDKLAEIEKNSSAG